MEDYRLAERLIHEGGAGVRDKDCSENGFRFPAPQGFAV